MLTCEACRTYGWPSRHGDRMLGLFLEATSPATASTTARRAVTPDMNLTRSKSEVGVPVAQAYSGGRSVSTPYSCVQLGVASGLRGGMIGAAFGGVFAISSASGSSQAVLTHIAQAAARNAAGFASWTAMYGFTKCELVKIRRTNDILNPAIAGFITGGVLSLATMPRGYWRYGQMQILQNAGGSAVVAVVFDIVNRL